MRLEKKNSVLNPPHFLPQFPGQTLGTPTLFKPVSTTSMPRDYPVLMLSDKCHLGTVRMASVQDVGHLVLFCLLPLVCTWQLSLWKSLPIYTLLPWILLQSCSHVKETLSRECLKQCTHWVALLVGLEEASSFRAQPLQVPAFRLLARQTLPR